jgi:hypothetical protein
MIFGAFLAEVVLITYRAVRSNGITTPATAPLPLPLPSEYLSAVFIYGGLGLVGGKAAPVAGLVGWGFVVATALNLFNPGAANTKAAAASSTAATLKTATTAAKTSK